MHIVKQVPNCTNCGEIVFPKMVQCAKCGHLRGDLLAHPALAQTYQKLYNDPKVVAWRPRKK